MEQFTGTRAVSDQHAFDTAALEAWLAAAHRRLRRPAAGPAVQGRSVQPDLQAGHARPRLRDAHQTRPGGQAAALGARDRARVPRHARAGRQRACRWPRMHVLCEDESVIGRAFYVMDFVDGRVLWDQSLPGMTAGRTRRDLRRDEPRHRGAAPGRRRRRRPGRLRQAGQLLRPPDRPLEQAVPGLGDRDRSTRWTSCSNGCRRTCRPARATTTEVSIVHGDFRLDNLIFHPTSRACWRCSTGSCRRWATRWPTSATTAWPGTSRPAPSAASAGWTTRRWASRRSATTCAATASAPAAPTRMR